MQDENKICDKCGEPLKESPFARAMPMGNSAVKSSDDLVCRNYPNCEKAVK